MSAASNGGIVRHPYEEMGTVKLAHSELNLIRFAYGNGPPSNEPGKAWPPRVAAAWYLAHAVLQQERDRVGF